MQVHNENTSLTPWKCFFKENTEKVMTFFSDCVRPLAFEVSRKWMHRDNTNHNPWYTWQVQTSCWRPKKLPVTRQHPFHHRSHYMTFKWTQGYWTTLHTVLNNPFEFHIFMPLKEDVKGQGHHMDKHELIIRTSWTIISWWHRHVKQWGKQQ